MIKPSKFWQWVILVMIATTLLVIVMTILAMVVAGKDHVAEIMKIVFWPLAVIWIANVFLIVSLDLAEKLSEAFLTRKEDERNK